MFPCPVCGGDSVCYHYRKNHWPVCERCRVRWWGGYGLITVPYEQTEEDLQAVAEKLRRYALVADDGPDETFLWRLSRSRMLPGRQGEAGEKIPF
jgi:hypothetical protein